MAATKSSRQMLIDPINEITQEEALSASLVLAGIAAAKGAPCKCLDVYESHHPDCPSCGLRDVLDALSLTKILKGEVDDEDL